MALSCKLNERIFTFSGKDYSYNEFRALMYDGLIDQALKPAAQVAEQAAPKGAVDASDTDSMQGLMERHEGTNAEGISKPQLIGRVVNGIRWLNNNKLGYDANTGKGNRIFVAESKAEYERITRDASGKAKTGGGVTVFRYDADGNYMGADIYISLDTNSLGTVAHELAHVALMEKFAADPELFKKFIEAIKPFTSAKDLAYLNKFVRKYADEEVRPEEFLAEMTALIEERFANGEVDAKELSALRKLAEAIKQFINKLTGGLVFPLEKESDVRAFFNALGQSIAVGGVMKEGAAEAAAREVDEAFSKQIASETNKPVEIRERIEEQSFGPKIKYKKGGYALSLVKESDFIDIKALVKKIADEGGRVWFWTADQLGRGVYSDDTLLGEHYLDAGPSFALDPENRKNNVIWASGLDDKTLNKYIGKSDYVFIVSGSPQQSKLFNKAVTKVLKERAEKATGLSWDGFTKKLIELDSQKEDGRPKKATVITKILEKYKSFDEFLNSGDRKDFFLQLEEAMGRTSTALAKYLKDKKYSLDVNELRDKFYAENGFEANDVMLVLKATGVDSTQRHGTYNKSIIGKVIGVPDRRVNAINLLPEEQQAKLSGALKTGTPMGGAGGATVRTLGTPLFAVEPKPRREAMERKEEEPRGKTASIAPFYRLKVRDMADAERVAKTPAYKNFESTLNDLADAMGVKIDSIKPGVGKWGGIMELSAKVQFAPGQKFAKIREYAAIMGALAPESQDTTIAGEYVKKGDKRATGYAIRIPTNDIDAAIALAESSGLHGLDIDTDSSEAIIFARNEKDAKQARLLAKQFRSQGIGTGKFTAEPLRTEFIGEAKRSDILRNVSGRLRGDGGRQQGGARLRDLVKLAQERDAAFQRLKGYEPTRKKYADLRNLQIELLEKGQDLSALDKKRLESNRRRLTPAIEQQFGSWQDAYQEAKDEIAKAGDRIAKEFEGYNIPFNIKNIGRATIKTLDWYMGHPTLLGDGARTTIIVDDIAKADEVFDRIKEEYYSPREENYTTDLGYPKRLLEVLTANGRLAEFQVMTAEAYLAKDGVELFPENERAEVTKRLNEIQSIIGAKVPDGMGHLFYELQRDPKVSSSLRDATKEPSNLYYKAFTDPESMKGKGDELMKSIASFMDKFKAEKANEGTWAAKHWTKNQRLVDKFNEAYSEPSKPKRREAMERKEDELPPDTPEETRKVITVAQRRLNKIEGDEKRATERDILMGDPGNYVDEGEYRAAIDQARNFVAGLYFKYANLGPVDFSKAVYEEVKGIANEVSKVVAYGELQASLDMYAESKRLSSKNRKEIQRISAKMVSDMAQQARRKGQANAALALVYNNYGKFASLVQAERINIEFTNKLNSTEGSEKGKTVADDIESTRDEIKEALEQNKEIADVVDLAEEVNDAMEDAQAAKVAAGESTPLDEPRLVTAEQLINDAKAYQSIIEELEEEVKRLDGLLAHANKLYASAAANAASYAQQIADLNREISRKNKLIDKLKDKKNEIAKERDKYKSQLETLKQKVQDLKDINKLLAQKRVGKDRLSPSKIEKLRQKLLSLALAGKLNDPDFDSVFAAITGGNFLTTQDRKAVEHMANALKYFEGTGQREMAQKYAKRLNDFLEKQSKDPWTAAKWAIMIQSWFYNSVLSSIGTLQNALVGSILVSIPNATATSIATALKNPKSGLGAMLYGMRRMLQEMPTAISKGAMNQRAYDAMGTSWTVDSVSKYADPFEVHVLNGFFRQWDKVKNNPSLLAKSKASVAMLASLIAQGTRITALLRFIDPVLRHSLAAHMEGMQDYIKIKGEMKLKKEGDASIAEAWTPYFSPKLIKKIDEMAGVARADRSAAATQARQEIAEMKSRGISVPLDYARRRASEIMREKRNAEQALTTDKMAADMIMMWRPDGVLGYIWDKTGKTMAIREDDKPFTALFKLTMNLTVLPFLRISAQGVSEIQSTIPVIGSIAAAYGVAKNKQGDWYIGKKYAEDVQDRELEMQRMARRLVINGLSTIVIASLFANVFDMEDAEEEDEDAMNVFGKKMKIKLDPDRWFDFTSDARGPRSANEGIMEGRANFSMRMRLGSDEEWTDWVSVRLAPHMTVPVAWLGRLSDDANRLYAEPSFGRGKIAKRAELNEYFLEMPMSALGEVSFQTLPRFFNTARYDAGAAAARMFMSPVAAIAQPSVYRDVVSTTASMAGASKRGEYMPEGFLGTSKAMFSSLYGMNYIVSPEITDEYGLPIKAIDPIRNFWKNYTDIEKRSDDYPEVNLRWRYGNTFIAATPRAQRLESVDRDISTIPLKEGVYSEKIELTKEQQYESALMAKALYRLNTLRNYDDIIAKAEAEKAKGKRGQMPGEVVSEELNTIHDQTMTMVKDVFSQYASGKKGFSQEKVLETISEIQKAADELSKKIMEGKPLPPAEKELQYYVGKNVIRVVM